MLLLEVLQLGLLRPDHLEETVLRSSVSSGPKPASHRNVYTYHLGLLFLLQLLVQLAQRRGPLVMRIARPNDRAASDARGTTGDVAGRLVQIQVQPRPTTTGHGRPVGAGRAARGLAREVGRSGHAAAVGSGGGGVGLGEGIEVGGHGEVDDAGVVVVVMVRQGRVDDASTPKSRGSHDPSHALSDRPVCKRSGATMPRFSPVHYI
jgi:hypothetical protein